MEQDVSEAPRYLSLHRTEELKKRGKLLWKVLQDCRLCPRGCRVDRTGGETGFCGASDRLKVASFSPHFGEEAGLVGRGGSGTIFLSHCNLGCVFCQNWDISHRGAGSHVEVSGLAAMMLRLQKLGCGNINVVTPTHFSPHIVRALDLGAGSGLRLPLVYNTCGWERKEILRLLDGIVDIYLADFKYTDPDPPGRYSENAVSYPEVTRTALMEMNRQVGAARPEGDGVIRKGLMIRHLVMPNRVSGSLDAVEWISEQLPRDTYVHLMIQYRPAYRAHLFPEIDRPVSHSEYRTVVEKARECGLTNLEVDL